METGLHKRLDTASDRSTIHNAQIKHVANHVNKTECIQSREAAGARRRRKKLC
jgi:hypothetical protein